MIIACGMNGSRDVVGMCSPSIIWLLIVMAFLTSCSSNRRGELNEDYTCLSFGGFFGGSMCEVRSGRIMCEWTNGQGKVQKRRSRKLSESEVADFWRNIETEDVFSWQPSYAFRKPDGRSDCGYVSWSLRAKRGDRTLESGGYGAYPDDQSPTKTKEHESSKRFDRVNDAFNRLLPSQ